MENKAKTEKSSFECSSIPFINILPTMPSYDEHKISNKRTNLIRLREDKNLTIQQILYLLDNIPPFFVEYKKLNEILNLMKLRKYKIGKRKNFPQEISTALEDLIANNNSKSNQESISIFKYTRYENGEANISKEDLDKLCKIFGETADYISYISNSKNTNYGFKSNVDKEKFKEIIKELRENNKMTQQAIAKKLGITSRAYQNYESGRCVPQKNTRKKMAEIFNVSLDELLGYSES